MARDEDTHRQSYPRRAGINPSDCPEKSRLIDCLLTGKPWEPKAKPPKPKRKRWGGPRFYDAVLKKWVAQP